MAHAKEPIPDCDKALASYQKSCLSLFYPSLIGFLATALGFSLSMAADFQMSVSRSLGVYLAARPLSGNAALSSAVSLAFAALIVVLFAFLALKAAKGKLWALIVASALYLGDFAYGIALIFPVYGRMGILDWSLALATHVVFLALFSLTFVKYVKLSRLFKKSRP
ncbi:MAG: hypothetical protein LKK13_02920 [Bacilli bacterium]|jgi:hypothetical protein|nr:hypothetical protein [Bacilli bacterium]